MQSFKLKLLGVTILQGVEFPIFLLIFAWALQQCSATALPVIKFNLSDLTTICLLWCFPHWEVNGPTADEHLTRKMRHDITMWRYVTHDDDNINPWEMGRRSNKKLAERPCDCCVCQFWSDVTVHLRLIGKLVVDLIFVLIELFCQV